jgi:DNA anti-recombination protein RmuC
MAGVVSQREVLRDRVNAKRKEMEAELLKARADAREQGEKMKGQLEKKLDELNDLLRDGWTNMTEEVASKLNRWLKDE